MLLYKIFISFFYSKYKYVKWTYESLYLSFNYFFKKSNRVKLFNSFHKKTLIIIPHSDDEWIGCSQLFKKSKELKGLYLNYPEYYSDKNNEIRILELKRLCLKYGVDLFISKSFNNINELLSDIIKNEEVEQIFIPSAVDWHPDHLKTVKIVQDFLISFSLKFSDSIDIFLYQISVPMPYTSDNMFYFPLSIRDEFCKWKYFKKNYISQKTLPTYRFSINEFLNARKFKINSFAVELYKQITLEQLFFLCEHKYYINERDISKLIVIRQKCFSIINML